jgi:RNA methyltransferase, TrmH family
LSIERISSRQNALVRQFRVVAQGNAPGRVLLDGEHLIEEALASETAVEVVAFSDRLAGGTLAQRLRTPTRIVTVSDSVLNAISPVRSPAGAVAIASRPHTDVTSVFARTPALVLLLHDVQDPGNVGAIVRAAEGCGATGVICGERTADPFGWKALRGSMGSAFRVPIAIRESLDATITAAKERGVRIYAATARGGTSLPRCNLRVPAAILLGGEGGGLPESLSHHADERLTIPMHPPVESLNVAIAAALVLYEAARQRHTDVAHVAL